MTSPQSKTIQQNQNQQQGRAVRIAIIGGGLTGLITATLLERQFAKNGNALQIDVFEKSRSIGRLATRYKQPEGEHNNKQWQFDFGAQFFTAKSKAFQDFIAPFIQQGILEPWHAKIANVASLNNGLNADSISNITGIKATEQWDDTQPRYISSPKMTTWGRALANALTHTTVHFQTRVAPLSPDAYQDGITMLTSEEGKPLGKFDWVICTAPSVQAAQLLAQTDFVHKQAINQAKMLACYTLMLGWQAENMPSALKNSDWDVLICDDKQTTSLLGKVFIEHHKPKREHLLPSVTIHASNDWSEQHVDDDIDNVIQVLLEEVSALFQWDDATAPSHIDCHRWRYAATAKGKALGLLVDEDKKWIVTGDWCGQGRIESCFDVANLVMDVLSNH